MAKSAKVTSEEVAKIAARYLDYMPSQLTKEFGEALADSPRELQIMLHNLTKDIRTLAASCLAQRPDDGGSDA